ncbi:MAG: hypothetical protein LH654_12905, partial [Thermoleophilia bacterium]|nr:hypothetical protein [Thermoleophilia bacterium]
RDQVDAADPLAVARGTLLALKALAARSPIVVAVDDLQWLDAASARALAYAVRRLEGERIGIVASLREGHPDPLDLKVALRERAVDVRLTGLSAGAVGHMVRRRVAESTPRRVVFRIHERSGGNPFFALELARAPDDALPASLRELVEQRLQTLPGEAALAVELAAILGSAPHTVFDEPASLDAAVAAGVLVEHEGEVRFAHPLLAAGAYELLAPSRRRALHRQAAGLSGSDEQRARHLALATSPPDAEVAAALEGAARAAHQRGASEFAVELAAHARRLTPAEDVEATAERTLLEGEYLYVTADEPAASERIDEVLASGVRGAVRARALLNASLYAVDPTLAVRRCEEAVAEIHDDARLAARSLSTLAWQRGAWLGDVERALPEAVAAVELARLLDDERTLATVLTCAGLICSLAADVRTEGFFGEAVEIAGRIHMVPGDRAPRSAFAHCLLWRGSYTRAASLLAVERAEAERDGDEGAIMRIGIFGGELESRCGNWDEAERLLAEALEEARGYWRIAALQIRALVRGRRGDPEAAVDAAEIASSPPAAADPVIAATADYARGLLAAAAGDVETAADLLTRLAGRTDRLGAYEERVVAAIPDATLALVEAGRIDEAELLTARLERRAAKGDHPWVSAAAELCRGSILLSTADIDASLARLAHSRKGFAGLGAQWELARTLLVEGNALRRAGRRTEAAASLDRAATVFGALRAEPWRSRSYRARMPVFVVERYLGSRQVAGLTDRLRRATDGSAVTWLGSIVLPADDACLCLLASWRLSVERRIGRLEDVSEIDAVHDEPAFAEAFEHRSDRHEAGDADSGERPGGPRVSSRPCTLPRHCRGRCLDGATAPFEEHGGVLVDGIRDHIPERDDVLARAPSFVIGARAETSNRLPWWDEGLVPVHRHDVLEL